jgi:type IV secretion system protein VirD4
VPALPKKTITAAPLTPFRDMTEDEAAGQFTRSITQDDIQTEDCPSFFADMLTLDQDGKISGIIEEGDENG